MDNTGNKVTSEHPQPSPPRKFASLRIQIIRSKQSETLHTNSATNLNSRQFFLPEVNTAASTPPRLYGNSSGSSYASDPKRLLHKTSVPVFDGLAQPSPIINLVDDSPNKISLRKRANRLRFPQANEPEKALTPSVSLEKLTRGSSSLIHHKKTESDLVLKHTAQTPMGAGSKLSRFSHGKKAFTDSELPDVGKTLNSVEESSQKSYDSVQSKGDSLKEAKRKSWLIHAVNLRRRAERFTSFGGLDQASTDGSLLSSPKQSTRIDRHPHRSLIFSPNVEESIFKKHLMTTHKGLTYSVYCLRGPSETFIRFKQVELKAMTSNREGESRSIF